MLGTEFSIDQQESLGSSRDDVQWTDEQSEQANAIINQQYEHRMSDTKWGE